MMQAFEWYLPSNQQHYKRLQSKLDELKSVGIVDLWIPPVFKGTSKHDVGYGIYDLYDLGEFDQKGSIATKYGTKQELIELIKSCHTRDMKVYADTVLNHKAAADYKETFEAILVDPMDREQTIGEPHDIQGWTGFNFKGRNNKYSKFKWNFNHFTGVDYDDITKESGIYRILGDNKYWSESVSDELGNYDYLMFSDVNLAHPEVKEDLFHWIEWFVNETKVDGLRFDALKHIDREFMKEFIDHCLNLFGDSFYRVGEYWSGNEQAKLKYLDALDYNMDLFDVILHYNFYEASHQKENYDLRTILDNTLVMNHPTLAVTFVDNHDSQRGQALESWVESWFKPLAYTLILMREEGYPCVFWGDYYGIEGEFSYPAQKEWLDRMLKARQKASYGDQDDYFDNPHCIGWVRHGNEKHLTKSASLINNSDDSQILRMFIGTDFVGTIFKDALEFNEGEVIIDEEGYGDFRVNAQSASIWLN